MAKVIDIDMNYVHKVFDNFNNHCETLDEKLERTNIALEENKSFVQDVSKKYNACIEDISYYKEMMNDLKKADPKFYRKESSLKAMDYWRRRILTLNEEKAHWKKIIRLHRRTIISLEYLYNYYVSCKNDGVKEDKSNKDIILNRVQALNLLKSLTSFFREQPQTNTQYNLTEAVVKAVETK